MRAAALQIEGQLGNLDANLEMCEHHADQAAKAGADWIVLPEFFASGGACNSPELARDAPGPDGAPVRLLRDLALRHGAHVGGSFLIRDPDGEVRNGFVLVGPDGNILGRHNKDMPTAWEGCLYIGGDDPGIIPTGELTVGVALCWELIRTQTVKRLVGKVDLVVGGSGWWSYPPWPPKALMRLVERDNARRAVVAPTGFAPYVGVPVVHAALSGTFSCPFPQLPVTYHGHLQGGASITDGAGKVLAIRHRSEGAGFAIADIEPGRSPVTPLPDRFWLQRRGIPNSILWAIQNPYGRRMYRRTRAHRAA